MDKRDFPNLGKTSAGNDGIRGGYINNTRGFLRRNSSRLLLVAAFGLGIQYVINAVDGLLNGEGFDGNSNNNKKQKR